MGASYLIDTHVLVWLLDEGPSPRRETGRLLSDIDNTLVVSAVTAYEIALKVHLGTFDEARPLLTGWSVGLARLQARELPVAAAHGLAAGSLHWPHRDPIDRLLIGQAIVEELTLVTADRAMLAAPGVDVLPW